MYPPLTEPKWYIQSVIRLYAVPMTAFTTEEDEGDTLEGEEPESVA